MLEENTEGASAGSVADTLGTRTAMKTEEMFVKLTDAERGSEAMAMVKVLDDIERLKHQVRALKERADEHHLAVSSGNCKRPVAVLLAWDYIGGRYTETRTDTGQVLTDRPLNDEEKQQSLI